MTDYDLVNLVNGCLNDSESQINFYDVSDSSPNVCLDSRSVLKTHATKGVSLPRAEVWYTHYNLSDFYSGENLGSQVKVPFSILDLVRDGKDPDELVLFLHPVSSQRLDVYMLHDKITAPN